MTESETIELEQFIDLCESKNLFETISSKTGMSVSAARTKFLHRFLESDDDVKKEMFKFMREEKTDLIESVIDLTKKIAYFIKKKTNKEEYEKDMERLNAPSNINDAIGEICRHFRGRINNEDSLLIQNNASGLSIIIMDTKEVPNIGRFRKGV